ncbi:MAG: carbohydrate ABC transporter permease [Lachnospiraceae bacterium]|nr:carbohydrate ABC transporter permease [Lachnospiraceae bacterium]
MTKVKQHISVGILVLFCIIALAPVYFLLINSLLSPDAFPDRQMFFPNTFSLRQYWNLIIGNEGYFLLYTRSLFIAMAATAGQLAVSVIAGFLFGKFSFKGRMILLTVYVIVLFLPYSATLLPNYMMLRSMNLLNTQFALILPAVFHPLGTIIMTIFIAGIPQETMDAALLETKSLFAFLRHIVLPQITPAIALTLIIAFTEAWNMVEQPQAMMENRLLHPLSSVLGSIFSGDRVNYAGSLLYILPPILLLFAFEEELMDQLIEKAALKTEAGDEK